MKKDSNPRKGVLIATSSEGRGVCGVLECDE